VGLPENFAFMGDDALRLELAPMLAERSQSFLVTMARRYQVALLGGGYPAPAGNGQTFNRADLVSKDGQLLARYDKIHLFDVTCPTATPTGSRPRCSPAPACRRWWRSPAFATLACPSATTCAFLSSTATSLPTGPIC
jgi:predicted amidohydrolase